MTSTPLTTGQRYLAHWRALPRELGFHALTMPIATTGFVVAVTLVSAGVGTIVTFFIGVFIFIAALYASRGFGTLELLRLEWAGRPPIERPVWSQPAPGFWGWMRSMFGNGHYWLYLLHTMVINFIISLITWTFMVAWVATALGGILYSFIPFSVSSPFQEDSPVSSWFFEELGFDPAPTGYPIVDVVVYTLTGLVFLATLPLVSRGLILIHEAIARGTLGAFTSDALRRQVGDLTASRGAAIAAEGHSLRRLERDIHDGPQQRLVRLQMDLAAAERQLDTDPTKAKKLIAEAMDQSKEALEELRALSRGFAPPILLDRGLVAALQSAADRSPVPVKVIDELGGLALPQEIERNAYFVVSEALANVAKHAGATESTVSVWVDDERALTVAVYDNGRGGAVATPGHGLAGLEERLLGLGGTLTVDSPDGGPTTILAHLPLAASI